MENKGKIAIGFFILLFSCGSGGDQTESIIDTREELEGPIGKIIVEKGSFIFEAPCLFAEKEGNKMYYTVNGRKIHFYSAVDYEDTISLDKVIDTASFRFVGGLADEKNRIRNPYFFNGRMNCYYVDKNHFYAYLDKPSPEFIVLGQADDATLLGGNYVRLGKHIYSNGIALSGVDVSSFHTMDLFQDRTEWKRTIGLDKHHLYVNEEVLTEERFENLIAPNDSLKKIYFPN